MKKLWTIASIIAVANVLALTGFTAWLVSGDRLNMDRVRDVRAMLSKTITQQNQEAEAKKLEEEAAKAKAEAERKAAKPPLTAAELLSSRVELTELDHQRMEKLREEVRAMQASLAQRLRDVEVAQARLDADRKSFDALVATMASQSKDEQFQKTLGVLQTLKAPQAKQMLAEMMKLPARAAGTTAPAFAPVAQNASAAAQPLPGSAAANAAPPAADEPRQAQAVEFLNAMEEKSRTKIIAEFAKEDPRLAAKLLDALRRRGQFARTDGGP